MSRRAAGLLLVALGVGSADAAEPRVAYTNIELLLSHLPEAREVERQMSIVEEKLAQRLDLENRVHQKRLNDYLQSKQNNSLTPAQDEAAVAELQNLEQEIQQHVQEAEQELSARRTELLAPVVEKTQRAIDEVAAEQGFDYVLNQTLGEWFPSIVYGAPDVDLTNAIAAKLGIRVE